MAGRSEESETKRRWELLCETIAAQTLVIFVWGPGAKDRKGYKKREDIRREIKRQFPNSEVHFSEDPDVRKLTEPYFVAIPDEELAHGHLSDLIFALDMASGVNQEIAHYCGFPAIATRLIVLAHEKFRDDHSFHASLRHPLQVQWFNDDDYKTCRLAKVLCTKHVKSFVLRRLTHEAGGGGAASASVPSQPR